MHHLYASAHDWEQLKKTLPRIYGGTADDRANWMERYYLSHAFLDLDQHADEVLDRYGITDRDRDSCGEMNDCPEVLAEMLRRMERDRNLAIAVMHAEGSRTVLHWRELAKHTRQAQLFH